MTEENQCGPQTDSDFFYELRAVFEKYPDAAQTYSIHCRTLESDIMRIDLERQVGVSRIEGNQIITEFRDSDDAPMVIAVSGCIREPARSGGLASCNA